MILSAVICTYNPNLLTLEIVLNSLKAQTLPTDKWELIIVDNKSDPLIQNDIDISWHPNALITREEKPGLLNARIKGFHLSKSPLIVFVDDDNNLQPGYFETAVDFYNNNLHVGSFGGKSLAVFEAPPPKWFNDAGISLGCQDHGDQVIISDFSADGYKISEYPFYAPIGTGMVITKKAFQTYIDDIKNDTGRLKLGRSGESLYSGEDNDMILTIIKNGFEIAYVPALVVFHIIPKKRTTLNYLSNMAYNSSRSWIVVLNTHQICPWKKIPNWSVIPRKAKAWVKYRAWKNPANYIKWRGACGMYEALSDING